jgi:hypothetical protein
MSNSTGGDDRVLADDLKSRTEVWLTKTCSSLQHHLTASNHPHNSMSSCCSLPVPITVLKRLHASFSRSKSLSQLRNSHSPLLIPRLRFLSFFKAVLLPNFKNYGQASSYAHGRSAKRTYLQRAWLNISSLGEKDLSAERRKSGGLPYSNGSIGLREPLFPFQSKRPNIASSESDYRSKNQHRNAATTNEMVTVRFCIITKTHLLQKHLDVRTLNLRSSLNMRKEEHHTDRREGGSANNITHR